MELIISPAAASELVERQPRQDAKSAKKKQWDGKWAPCYNSSHEAVMPTKAKQFTIPRKRIADFCKRWNVSEFAIFGSALRADFRPDSDIDVLVSFAPGAEVSLFDMVHMQDELKQIFNREVDLISKRGVETSRNYLRRKAILESAQVIHVT
jgi:hypothetical protein